MCKLSFEIKDVPAITVDVKADAPISANIENVTIVSPDATIYDGAYEATPKMEVQELPTKGKTLEKNVVVNPVPVWRTANGTGGNTVYIAAERSK